jgi:ABC-type multidrug transport system fused ATPase/permease subunit
LKKKNLIQCEFDENKDYSIIIENAYFSWGVKQKKNEDDDNEKKDNNNKDEKIKVGIEDEKIDKKKGEKEDEICTNKIIEDNDKDEYSSLKHEEDSSIKEIKERIKTQIKIPENIDYDIILKDISFKINKGEIIGIIGEVGSGKSSLLQSILNALILLNPNECKGIYINGSIGYVSQIPWIQNETIKNNVLFFNEYDEKKYREILELSQLNYDLSNFEGGDLTEIGEKGVNLSGGQKLEFHLQEYYILILIFIYLMIQLVL